MAKRFKQLLIGASVCIGAAIVGTPAWAVSLTNASVTGTANYLTYGADSKNTFLVPNDPANLAGVLTGNISSPTGNVELFSNSESLSNTAFQSYTGVSTLSGKIGGRDITLSSLTLSDWLSPVGTKTLGQTWLDSALQSNGLGTLVGNSSSVLFNIFTRYGGLQRFSDPNIAYVNQDDTGLIRVGLAGHLNATPLLLQSFTAFLADSRATSLTDRQAKALIQQMMPSLSSAKIQASELVKYTYNGLSGYLYSFSGTNSGLVEKGDGISHNATYEVTIAGLPPEKPVQDVPEPSLLLGLLGMSGMAIARRNALKKA